MVQKVIGRICEEMIDLHTGYVDTSREPLRWAMHGGPGTGKRMSLKLLKKSFLRKY